MRTKMRREVAVRSWTPGIAGAVKGPFQAFISEERETGWADITGCQHRHLTTAEAFTCGKAQLAELK